MTTFNKTLHPKKIIGTDEVNGDPNKFLNEKGDFAPVNVGDGLTTAQVETIATTKAAERFTTEEKNKLAGLESSKWKGSFTSLANLQAAYPAPEAGWSADVDGGAGAKVIRYVGDVQEGWIAQLGESNAETAASILTKYESNPDRKPFTDALNTKLGNVQANATKNSNTDELTEGAANLYFTEQRSMASRLLGYVAATADTVLGTGVSLLAAIQALEWRINQKEPAFTKKTAHNKDFGVTAGTVSEGNHAHAGMANTTTANTFTKPTVHQADTAAGVAATSQNNINGATGNLHEFKKASVVVAKIDINGGSDATNFTKAGVQKWVDQTYINPAFTNVVNDVPPAEMAKLTTANWSGGDYTGEPIINTTVGMSFKSGAYRYVCDEDNVWSRLSRV